MTTHLTFIQPDDWHVHVREGDMLALTVPAVASVFARAIIMPNLKAPILNVGQAEAYAEQIHAHIPSKVHFQPLMTLYLTEQTTPAMIDAVAAHPSVYACKLYFAGATTQAQHGVRDVKKLYPVFEAMQRQAVPLLIHGEMARNGIDVFDQESYFIEQCLIDLLKQFPALRIVFEHISTREAVHCVKEGPKTLAATITPHHLLYNRNHLLAFGIRPHYYCLPIMKRSEDQEALVGAATSGNPKFFLGTDSAPHPRHQKEATCGCAGIYNMPVALSLYAHVFEKAGALARLEGFASLFGATFYGLPYNRTSIRLVKKPWRVSESMTQGTHQIIPLAAGQMLDWQVERVFS